MHNPTCITSGPYILVRANILPAESVKKPWGSHERVFSTKRSCKVGSYCHNICEIRIYQSRICLQINLQHLSFPGSTIKNFWWFILMHSTETATYTNLYIRRCWAQHSCPSWPSLASCLLSDPVQHTPSVYQRAFTLLQFSPSQINYWQYSCLI